MKHGCLFFAGIDIKDEAEKLAKRKEETKKNLLNARRGGTREI